ncbi:MAG: hydrolase [Lachnospiraceae bacterium]|jgi:cell wall-associated NlpC family hydrolase|nr:hydrolase [Lachnospiraceae bacterium]MCI9470268.1 hydrolase [Lachnospiraceae bacterium]
MKNNLIRKLLCITLISAMIISSSFSALASGNGSASENGDGIVWQPEVSEETEEPVETPEVTEVPDPTETPTVTPEPTVEPTVTPSPTETVSPTETPSVEPTVPPTGVPGADDIDGVPVDEGEKRPNEGNETGEGGPEDPSITVDNAVAAIDAIGEVTLDKEGLILSARSIYDMLSEEQKARVSNYNVLVAAEEALAQLKEHGQGPEQDPGDQVMEEEGQETVNEPSVIEGPVTMISSATHVVNLKAGRTFYLKQLKSNYSLSFDEKFEDVMDEIEEEYIKANKLDKEDEYLVHNWQDILAVYVMEQERAGKKSFKLDDSAKDALASIFAEMNAVERDKKNIALVNYKNMHVEDYIKEHKSDLTKDEVKTLRKYADQDCGLLCATITAAKGFIRQSAGEEVSEERVSVIQAGYSLVGKVAYFWGGKSSVLGWDDRWGSAAKVSAEGSSSTGRLRAYGLDCSGFVDWAFNNGYQDTDMENLVGHGTSDQWNRAETIEAKEAQAGDLVFQRGPEAGSDNHVGILVGRSTSGDWIAVHCSGSQNGVTVGEAYTASFRYIRRPTVYPTLEELRAEKDKKKTELLEAANKKSLLRQAVTDDPNQSAQLDQP